MFASQILVYGAPVESLCHTLLGVLTLFPGNLENCKVSILCSFSKWVLKCHVDLCLHLSKSESLCPSI